MPLGGLPSKGVDFPPVGGCTPSVFFKPGLYWPWEGPVGGGLRGRFPWVRGGTWGFGGVWGDPGDRGWGFFGVEFKFSLRLEP